MTVDAVQQDWDQSQVRQQFRMRQLREPVTGLVCLRGFGGPTCTRSGSSTRIRAATVAAPPSPRCCAAVTPASTAFNVSATTCPARHFTTRNNTVSN